MRSLSWEEVEKIPDEEKNEALLLLTKSRGWQILVTIAEIQIGTRKNQVLYKPLEGESGIYIQEFLKGEIQGMESLLRLPQTIVDSEALAKKVE